MAPRKTTTLEEQTITSEVVPARSYQLKKSFMQKVQGDKEHPTWKAVLDALHQLGLKSIETDIVQVPTESNGNVAICKARITLEDGSFFEAVGLADPSNVPNKTIAKHMLHMSECVPTDTQILTKNGFKYHDEVSVGDLVLSYDSENDQSYWVPLEDKVIYNDPQPVFRVHSKSFSALCTFDHTWALRINRKTNKRQLKKLSEMNSGHSLIQAAPAESGTSPINPDEAAILGWLATDGHVRDQMVGVYGPYKRATISQSKPHYVEELKELVVANGYGYQTSQPARQRNFSSYISECLPQHKFDLTSQFAKQLWEKSGMSGWADLPKLVCELSSLSRASMIDAMLKGDGSKSNSGTWTFGQKAKPGVSEAFTILCTLEGLALGKPRMSSIGDVPVQSIRNRTRFLRCFSLNVNYHSESPVWCPTTKYGTWIMNQNGVISITGNTRAKGRAGRDAINAAEAILAPVQRNPTQEEVDSVWSGPDQERKSRVRQYIVDNLKSEFGDQVPTIASLADVKALPESYLQKALRA